MDAALVNAYQARLRELGARDLDDLLLDALAADAPADGRFDHLLVDEFQDINAVQRALVRHWSATGESLFVIGDPDQSIYGFRGADANCFESLRADLPELETIPLTVNYRSAPDILRRAAACIAHNPGPVRKLRPRGARRRARASRARGYGFFRGGMDRQGDRPAGRRRGYARRLRDGGRDARLFRDGRARRTHRQLDLIEECLTHDGIPCLVAGREEYLEDDGVRGALAFFRSLAAPGDRGQPARRPAPQLEPWRRRPAPRRRL